MNIVYQYVKEALIIPEFPRHREVPPSLPLQGHAFQALYLLEKWSKPRTCAAAPRIEKGHGRPFSTCSRKL
jgi:hypothetical protein